MSIIAENIQRIQKTLPQNVALIAVSKFRPAADIAEAYQAGQQAFGENKAQEMAAKQPQLPTDIQWHFIGHLQRNKVKYIAPFVHLVHSVDSGRLLEEINYQGKKCNRLIDCLLQFYIAQEESKFGFSMEEAEKMLQSGQFKQMQHIRLCGVMGMASLTDNRVQIQQEFQTLKQHFDYLKSNYFAAQDHFKEISMGMTDDYLQAIAEGSTMVRIGSAIFGKRNRNMPFNPKSAKKS
ncbi:MAG: YggS family pyridoxal phosphate-dependent enzyme [Lentimicrobiaceae bacterium]|nr:YggS family pyridoxal phosphate-dependent enzyme [Lentimicrobiaceae bacterium]